MDELGEALFQETSIHTMRIKWQYNEGNVMENRSQEEWVDDGIVIIVI